jgi:hypothetical protein
MTDIGPFRVTRDLRLTYEELIAAGGYGYVHPKVELLRPLIERTRNRAWLIANKRRSRATGSGPYRTADPEGDGAKAIAMGIIKFWGQMRPEAAPAFADLLGKRLAGPEELLSFVATQPPLPDRLWVLAIGGSTDIIGGRLPALSLRVENGKKLLLADELCRCALWHSPVLLTDL